MLNQFFVNLDLSNVLRRSLRLGSLLLGWEIRGRRLIVPKGGFGLMQCSIGGELLRPTFGVRRLQVGRWIVVVKGLNRGGPLMDDRG